MTRSKSSQGTPLRQRMIEDMTLAGLAPRTMVCYIDAVRALAGHYRRSPDQISEEEVRSYILGKKAQGAARGSFKVIYHGIRFLYVHTLNYDWPLFDKKRFASQSRSAFPMPSPTNRLAIC